MTEAFRSAHHPGATPAALVYGRALLGPLAFGAVPLMLAATAAALQQTSVLPFLVWGLPAALVLATLWTRFRLGAIPAEVRVRPHQIAVRSVHDCLRATAPHWQRIHGIRHNTTALIVTAGFDTYRFPYADWPDPTALLDALRAARTAAPEADRHASMSGVVDRT